MNTTSMNKPVVTFSAALSPAMSAVSRTLPAIKLN